MAFDIKKWFRNYLKKKKPLSIFFDALFLLLIILMLIPSTRKPLSAFLIRTTAFPASALDEEDQYQLNKTTLAWQVYDIEGNSYSLNELNNKPVFLNLWATWCPPCIAELPAIKELYEDVNTQVNFILLSNENPTTVKTWLEKKGYDELPIYFADYTPPELNSQTIPATFVIDKTGKVVLAKKGAARWNSDKTIRLLKQLYEE